MDDFLKDKINYCYNFIKSNVSTNENCQLIEKKRKIYYFSKFSLDVDEFYLIFQTVKKIKENVFKNNLECLKYCARCNIIFLKQFIKVNKTNFIFINNYN